MILVKSFERSTLARGQWLAQYTALRSDFRASKVASILEICGLTLLITSMIDHHLGDAVKHAMPDLLRAAHDQSVDMRISGAKISPANSLDIGNEGKVIALAFFCAVGDG